MAEGLQAAEEVLDKWNASTWMRPRHLFGLLCQEKRRRLFAITVLTSYGVSLAEVAAALAAAYPDDAGSGQQQLHTLLDKRSADKINHYLFGKFRELYESGGFDQRGSFTECMLQHGLLQRGASGASALPAGVKRELPSPPPLLAPIPPSFPHPFPPLPSPPSLPSLYPAPSLPPPPTYYALPPPLPQVLSAS